MIWLIGNKGMLGSEIEALLKKSGLDYVASDRGVDITDKAIVEDFIKDKKIDWMVNCSAYTKVDRAESDSDLCEQINAKGPLNLAEVAKKAGAKLIHFSTDYVFDGTKESPYLPGDAPNPQSVYGLTKLKGEKNILATTNRFFIIRIAWLYGKYGPNFVKTMKRLFGEREELKIVSDQIGAPTYAFVLAQNVIGLIQKDSNAYGVYHYLDAGRISWYDFAVEIYRQAESRGFLPHSVKLLPVPTSEYPTPARRPAFSLLDTTLTQKKLGFKVRDWKENLTHYFDHQ